MLVAIIAILTVVFVASAVSGVAKGIQWLSNINMVLAIAPELRPPARSINIRRLIEMRRVPPARPATGSYRPLRPQSWQ